jgi:integron integrase
MTIRSMHYALKTERNYVFWIKQYILFNNKRHPIDMWTPEVSRFLTHLAVNRNVSPATQNQALCAIVFLYKHVLKKPLDDTIKGKRAKRRIHVPVVLSPQEIQRILSKMQGLPKLMAMLCYGTGMRKMECHRLRVKDIDFDRGEITVRQGKGNKDRRVPLPDACRERLKTQIALVESIFVKDREDQIEGVELPYAIGRKYPKAGERLAWQWVFPSLKLSFCPRTGIKRRHHCTKPY